MISNLFQYGAREGTLRFMYEVIVKSIKIPLFLFLIFFLFPTDRLRMGYQ